MLLKQLTSPALISIRRSFQSTEEVIRYLIRQLADAGKLRSEEEFYQAVMDREKQSATGLEGGLAIPHGKSEAVKEGAFAVVTLEKPLTTWESLDPDNQVELVIMLAIPKAEEGTLHLSLLAELATRLANPEYKDRLMRATSSQELYERLDEPAQKEQGPTAKQTDRTILAVTACAAGIAHTYMAAEALQRAGQEMGVAVHVEKQGAVGIEDRHTPELLRKADAVIFAVDVAVKEEGRYAHLPQVKTTVAAPLRNAREIIQRALEKAETTPREAYREAQDGGAAPPPEEEKPRRSEIREAIMTGISHIIPIIVGGGMTLAVAVMISQAFGLQELYGQTGSWLWLLRQLGGTMLGTLMVPVLAAYMSFSIADKPGMGPGFAAGVAANLINGGFLGGMLGGLIAGYLMRGLKNTIRPRGTFAGFISFWLYPVLGTLVVGALMLFVVGRPLAAINQGMIAWLNGLSGANALVLGAILGGMVSFDLGGPVNKAAYAFCIGAMANGNFVPYAAFASVKMVSAFAVTGATLFGARYFTDAEQEVGRQTWLLGLAGITEGAIPFMMNDPLRVIPSLVIGSAITGALVAWFNIGLNVPGAGIFSMAFLQGQPLWLGAAVWLGGALLGAWVSMMLLIATRRARLRTE